MLSSLSNCCGRTKKTDDIPSSSTSRVIHTPANFDAAAPIKAKQPVSQECPLMLNKQAYLLLVEHLVFMRKQQ